MQLAARTPANAAMSAATVDAMAGGGRFIAGLGVSGPQIVEGWYGQPWGKPYYRMKDYVAIMRKIFAREAPVTHDGKEITLPYTGPGAMGIGKPLKSILHMNPDIPIYLGDRQRIDGQAHRRDRRRLAAHGLHAGRHGRVPAVARGGFPPRRQRQELEDFAIQASVHVEVENDVKAALGQAEARGGALRRRHGPQDKNFHNDIMVRRGFGDAAKRIQELYLAQRKDEAIAAVPDEWVDMKSLVGPPRRASASAIAPGRIAAPIRSACARASPRPSKSWRRPRASTEGAKP